MSFHSSTASRDYLTLPSLEYLLNLVVIHPVSFIRTVDKFSLVHSRMFLIFSIFSLVGFLSLKFWGPEKIKERNLHNMYIKTSLQDMKTLRRL